MSKVLVTRSEYDEERLRPAVFRMMDALGGGSIAGGAKVLIKPNLLAPAAPDKAMLTHPLIVKAVAEYALGKGARVLIADSPAMGAFDKILSESGIQEAVRGLDVECRELKESIVVDVGEPFKKIEIAEDALTADIVINLPKLKTHSQMLLTLGVKNLFGCVVGLRKPEWHFRAGVDRDHFATLLVRICEKVKPAFNLLDGILSMEGDGPGKGGIPRHLGILMGSTDAFALDAAVCRILGVSQEKLLTSHIARKLGLIEGHVRMEGDAPAVKDFRLPQVEPLVFGPRFTHSLSRKHLVQRPLVDPAVCRLCGECWEYCPANAISRIGKKIAFDYDRCIRCYCCLEVCPHGALRTELPMLGKLFSRLIRRTS